MIMRMCPPPQHAPLLRNHPNVRRSLLGGDSAVVLVVLPRHRKRPLGRGEAPLQGCRKRRAAGVAGCLFILIRADGVARRRSRRALTVTMHNPRVGTRLGGAQRIGSPFGVEARRAAAAAGRHLLVLG